MYDFLCIGSLLAHCPRFGDSLGIYTNFKANSYSRKPHIYFRYVRRLIAEYMEFNFVIHLRAITGHPHAADARGCRKSL